MPSISIIVPVFDGVRYLPYFLQSLVEAAPIDSEVIFVDDASSEPVFEVIPDTLPRFKKVLKLRNPHNQGYSAAVNRGFSHATGEILVQLNTDLVMDPNCISAMVDLLASTPNVGIVGSKQILPTTGLVRHIGIAFGRYSERHIYAGLPASYPLCCRTRKMQTVSGATAAMTRSVLNVIGPLDEGYYNTRENFDHCLKASKEGFANYTCAESVTYHWVSQSGPARFARVEEDEIRFWSEWGSNRYVDLDLFVNEALDHLLTSHSALAGFPFEPISLCRSGDEEILLRCLEARWKGASSKLHRTAAFNRRQSKVWLPMELPHHMMVAPIPFIYLVDELSQLSENRLWFETRQQIVETEFVMDVNACVVTTRELCEFYGASS